MKSASIDPEFLSYLRDPPRLTYSQADDGWVRRKLVSSLEALMGRKEIEAVYKRLKGDDFNIESFFGDALSEMKISADFDEQQLKAIPKTGPLMFVANHPFGVVDGLILCDLAAKVRGDLRIMLNSQLFQDKDLAPYFLPIDFSNTKSAIRTNIRSKQLALEHLSQDLPVLIFPSGMVSTATRFGFGEVKDGPWTTFAAKIIKEAQATVVPCFFHGRNSRKFHVASHIAEPLRMALLMHEALKRRDQKVRVEIGSPMSWQQLSKQGDRKRLTKYLYGQVQALSELSIHNN
ncbi:lysophospholipid acyltransferase family protein [Paraglaciecola sp.]|uniref:lysophospholipid acyltransferase family protein n=1 Tax=Paraglaciecola sp. TaxID=1920173 RepID=UPI0032968DC8